MDDKKEVKLSIKNLRISFRTDGGKVQAVRDISFDLNKGETLAVVGESGSGKSVTSRAVLGILANNAIKEGGEILYDGQDLMKISEEEFCKLRGDKIAMIFQDPLSSLNPIMRVGKQMTEAMLIKGKLNRRTSRKDFNSMLARLNKCMDAAVGKDDAAACAENKKKCADFDKFECRHLELENAFVAAKEAASEAVSAIDDILFHIEKNATAGMLGEIKEVVKRASASTNRFVVDARADELTAAVAKLKALTKVSPATVVRNFVKPIFDRGAQPIDKTDYAEVAKCLGEIKDILAEAIAFDEPNFFSLGYYLTFSSDVIPDMSVAELNAYTRKDLDDKFMLEFIDRAKSGIKYSNMQSVADKKVALVTISENIGVFDGDFDKKQAYAAARSMVAAVETAIDRLDTVKDNISYTFRSSIKAAIDGYFDGIVRNAKEEKRYAKQKASYDKKVAAGKTPDWKVADKNLVDLDAAKAGIRALIERIKTRYERDIAEAADIDFDARAVAMIDYLKLKASGVAHKVTRSMAKAHALKLMEEVGIPEPRKRFRQYPFEFSGGMRQRIVIAIALSANPDILICDEPTTALDVTIQSQILELINKVKEQRQLSVIFITHDLGVVANMADRVAVMYAGKIVEIGTSEDVFYSPAHPYTWALLSSMPDLDTKEKLEAIPGTPPNMIYPPKGDAFAERNKYAMEIDFEEQPPMFRISDTHSAATWLLHPNAPKIDPPKAITERIARMKKAADEAERLTAENNDLSETVEAVPSSVDADIDDNDGISAEEINARTMGGDIADEAKNAGVVPDPESVATLDVKPIKKPAARKMPAKRETAGASAAKKTTSTKSTASAKPSTAKTSAGTAAKKTTAAPKSTAAKPSTRKSSAKTTDAKSDKE